MNGYGSLFQLTLPETILEVVSLVILVVDLGLLRKSAQATRMAVACWLGVVGCGLSICWLGGYGTVWYQPDSWFLAEGSVLVAAQIAVLVLTALVLLLSVNFRFSRNPGEFAAIVLLATTGMMLVMAAKGLLIIFVALELLSLSLYVLTAFAKSSPEGAEAALKYYLFGGMSAALMLFGFSYLYGLTGTTELGGIAKAFAGCPVTPLEIVALALVAAGLGFKVAAAPFHLWAPDTYQGAPAPVTALIASGSKVASFAVLIVVTGSVIGYHPEGSRPSWTILLLAMAGASIVLGNLAALAQTSVRRILAYSAIAHAGYMLLGVAAHSGASSTAVLYYAITYALTTVGTFGAVGIVERAMGSDRLEAFAGLSRKNPLLAGTMMVYFLSLAGIPPLVGFWAKFNLFAAVLKAPEAGHWAFAFVAAALGASAVSLYYYLQVLKRVYVVPGPSDEPVPVSGLEMVVLVVIALAVVGMGLAPAALSGWIPLG